MGTINKDATLENTVFGVDFNGVPKLSIQMYLEDLDSTSPEAFMSDAYDTCGYTIGEAVSVISGPTNGDGSMEVVNISVKPASPTTAIVIVEAGVPQVPITMGDEPFVIKYIWDTNSSVRGEQRAWDVAGNALIVRYRPKVDAANYMSDVDWAKLDNIRRFQQTATALKYRNWETAVAHCRLHWTAVEALDNLGWHPLKWHKQLGGNVNDELDANNPNPATKGIWLCQGVVATPVSGGCVYDVRVTFARNDEGWDTVLRYQDPINGNKTPKEIGDALSGAAAANFKLPYPDNADRELQGPGANGMPWGMLRPKMHNLFNFNQNPLLIDLSVVTG